MNNNIESKENTAQLTDESVRKNRLWKPYKTKDEFEDFYSKNATLRYLYCNERNPDGTPCLIYLDIDGTKKVAYWYSDGVEDVFVYRTPTFGEWIGAE